MSLLLDQGADINRSDAGETLLSRAVHNHDKEMVLLLLDRGADINMVFDYSKTALTAAAFHGNIDAVSLLLDRGADINMVVPGTYGSALVAAAVRSNTKIPLVSLLLDRGADINMVCGEYGAALIAAIVEDHSTYDTAMVSLLLDRGADVNIVVNNRYGTALLAAAVTGNQKMVMGLLLDRGANVNMIGGEYGTALIAAANSGNWADSISVDAVSLLLNRGADVNMVVDGEYGTALATAVMRGRKPVIELLLDRGANIDRVGGQQGTALIAACNSGRGALDLVSLLLERGADVNIVADGQYYGSALAAAGWNTDIMRMLLDRGANTNTICGQYGSALASAVLRNYRLTVSSDTKAVLLLLNRGADINMALGGEYGTVLAAAASRGRVSVVGLLLDRRADIDMAGGKYGTALAAAAFHGRKDAVSLLLDRGADINRVADGKYRTALAAAADVDMATDKNSWTEVLAERKAMVSLLVDRGANIDLVTGASGTVLGWAIYKGSTEMACHLLECGADVMRVGGSYPTASGVYPGALDVAHSSGSNANTTLVVRLQSEAQTATRNASVDDVISCPPFPMPYAHALCTSHHDGTLPSNMGPEFCAGSNITEEQADVLCEALDKEVLWQSLAALIGLHEVTNQEDTNQQDIYHQWIHNDVCYFVACSYDFGLAYAAARVAWKHFNEHSPRAFSLHRARWHEHAQLLDEARSEAIEIDSDHSSSGQVRQELIISPYSIMPRRLWDLKSNRVVDFRMLHAVQSTTESIPPFWAVTHSWTDDMFPVWTSINQRQWPVPLPKDINLKHLRSELLTLGAEYVWLDVLCLRQKSENDDLEEKRQEEWKLDVPTIGNIYRTATNIIRYFNGLGVPFSNKDWDGPRHWLQRAWTLQEIAAEKTTINGGIPRDRGKVLLNSQGEVSGIAINFRSALRSIIQLAAQVDSRHGCDLYDLAREMSRRHASQPVDKVSGLFYLLRTTKLPCYDANRTCENIWKECFRLLPPQQKAEILLDFPYRGSEEQWFPSWAQVLDWPTRDPQFDHLRSQISPEFIKVPSGGVSLFIRNIWTVPDVIIHEGDNPGEYEVSVGNLRFGFYLPYLLQEPIDLQDSEFTLALVDFGYAHNWVVCKPIDKSQWPDIDPGVVAAEFKVLKKVGIIRTDSGSELSVRGMLQSMDCLFV